MNDVCSYINNHKDVIKRGSLPRKVSIGHKDLIKTQERTNMEYKTALRSNNWCMFLIVVTSSYSA